MIVVKYLPIALSIAFQVTANESEYGFKQTLSKVLIQNHLADFKMLTGELLFEGLISFDVTR